MCHSMLLETERIRKSLPRRKATKNIPVNIRVLLEVTSDPDEDIHSLHRWLE